jgi:hypothetical protein
MRFLLVSLVAFAALGAHDEPALVSGMGTLGCAKLNEQLVPSQGYGQNKLSIAVFSWVQGFSSALNVIGVIQSGRFSDLKSITEDEQWSHIVKFCQQNPDAFIFDAAREMIATRLKVETAPPPQLTR